MGKLGERAGYEPMRDNAKEHSLFVRNRSAEFERFDASAGKTRGNVYAQFSEQNPSPINELNMPAILNLFDICEKTCKLRAARTN
jgi:hypothetical protein